MTQDDNQDRYTDILKRIANRKPFGDNHHEKQTKSTYDLILDYLNVYDTMAALPLKPYKHILCYGPQVIRRSNWSGVTIWYRNKGYYGYQILYLLGVWAHTIEQDLFLTVGIRELAYHAAIYNAEGYHASIQQGFKTFYEDDGHPATPHDTLLLETPYEQKERLTLRQTLDQLLRQWRQDVEID